MATRAPGTDGRRSAAAARRRAREKEIIAATRALFDERGVRDAQIEDIARAVGINRAIVYRHFSGKEELFALTLVGYLDELHEALESADDPEAEAPQRLEALVGAFVDYGLAHPAFIDCAQALMRRSGPELLDEISESALFRLGRGISGCLAILQNALQAGVDAGTSGSTTRPCWPTRSTPAASAPSSSRGSASWSPRRAPAYPRSARSRPPRSARTSSTPRSRSSLADGADQAGTMPQTRAPRPPETVILTRSL